MGGPDGFVSKMVVSTDLGNSSHYDVNDGSISVSILIEEKPHQAQNFWFIKYYLC